MAAFRFRIRFVTGRELPQREVVLGVDRTLDEFQRAINAAFGFDQYHLWFFGNGDEYWDSTVKYQHPDEYEDQTGADAVLLGETTYNAAETTMGEMANHLELAPGDSLCYLYDYGDECRFDCTLLGVEQAPADSPPELLEPEEASERTPGVTASEAASERTPGLTESEEADTDSDLPAAEADDTPALDSTAETPIPPVLAEFLPETPVPRAELRDLESRAEVVHVLVLLEDADRRCERFAIQFDDGAYLLENFPYGWDVITALDGTDATEKELLADLAEATREWHAEIAETAAAATDQAFDSEAFARMDAQLVAELERTGYGHL